MAIIDLGTGAIAPSADKSTPTTGRVIDLKTGEFISDNPISSGDVTAQQDQQPVQQEEQGILSSAGDMVADYYKQRVGDAEALMAMGSGSLPTMAVAGVAGSGRGKHSPSVFWR